MDAKRLREQTQEKHLKSQLESKGYELAQAKDKIVELAQANRDTKDFLTSTRFSDRLVNWFSPSRGARRLLQRKFLSAAYKAASHNRLRADWNVFGDDSPNAPVYELRELRSRSRDANRNDPVASGITSTYSENIVGSGLKPQSRIRADYLGISPERADLLQKQAERAWMRFSPMADASNRLDIDELQFLALSKIIEDGETIVLPTWANEEWRHFGRCIELVESERLSSPPVGGKDAKDIIDGIRFGSRGQPVKYFIKKSMQSLPGDREKFAEISPFDSQGRPKILHIFRTKRPGQARGVPLFAPVLTYFKDLADYLEAEVVAARVAACLAVFVTKADPMAAAIGFSGSTEASGARIQGIEPGMVGYLNIGESINVVDPKRTSETFNSFLEGLLRIIGASLGLPYELVMKDFSKTNYSSARAALLEGRRIFINWRQWFAKKFCQPIWNLVLEEAYLRGEFEAGDFYENFQEYTRAQWIGGAWGWVDPVKEVEASRKAVDYGFSTVAEEAAGQGRDWEEVFDQREREIAREEEIGIKSAVTEKAPMLPDTSEEPKK